MTQRSGPVWVSQKSFGRGVDLLSPETALPKGAVRCAVNVDFVRGGKVRRRRGSTLLVPAPGAHSIWSPDPGTYALYVAGTQMFMMQFTTTGPVTTVVRTGLMPDMPVCYHEVNTDVYFSNGVQCGFIFDHYGVELPDGEIVCSALPAGMLPAGTYSVALVYVKDSGEESGAVFTEFTLPKTGGINIMSFPLPADPTIRRARFFVSHTDGERAYQALDVNFTETEIVFSSLSSGRPVETMFMVPPPPAQQLCLFHGRLYGAHGNILWYTQPLRYGLHKPSTDYIDLGEYITLVVPAPDDSGLFVGTESGTKFLRGEEAKKFHFFDLSPLSPTEGSVAHVDTARFQIKEIRQCRAPVWFTERGWVLGADNGVLYELNQDKLLLSKTNRGSTVIREANGSTHLLGVFRGGGSSGAVASDSMTSEIVRKGVVIKEG